MNSPQTETPLHAVWLLKLVFQFPYGGFVSGLLIFLSISSAFWFFAEINEVGALSILFLSGMLAYIVPIYSLIVKRSEQAFDALEHLLDADSISRGYWRQSLRCRSASWMLTSSSIGLILGFAHSTLVEMERGGSFATIFNNSSSATITALATIALWLTMTTVISCISANAWLFYRLGRDQLRINLLATGDLVPLAWVSVASTLSLIGAQALFSLLIFDPGAGIESVLPGFLATAIPMFPLLLLPIWSVHKRLRLAKAAELESINQKLSEYFPNDVSALKQSNQLPEVNELLIYRREIANVREWPFDLGVVSRLGIYLIIPPITWVGAALIESLVENLL